MQIYLCRFVCVCVCARDTGCPQERVRTRTVLAHAAASGLSVLVPFAKSMHANTEDVLMHGDDSMPGKSQINNVDAGK